jgi:hypothetical protein
MRGAAMPQLSLYLDYETMEIVRRNAELENRSVSKYVAKVLREKTDRDWPDWFWGLCGAIDDEGFVEPEDVYFDQVSAREALS